MTADLGNDSVLVVWETETGTPVKTIFNPNPGGVKAVAISEDSEYIASLGAMLPDEKYQTLYVWKRDSEKNDPVAALEERPTSIEKVIDFDYVVFKAGDYHELALTGPNYVFFLQWKEGERTIKDYYKGEDKSQAGRYTMTSFIKDEAVTATDEGKIIVWGKSVLSQAGMKPDRLSAIKIVQVGPPAKKGKEKQDHNLGSVISVLMAHDNTLIAGFGDGSVKFYSDELKILMWFERFGASEIKSISFSLSKTVNNNVY